jgi:hypothetical protein
MVEPDDLEKTQRQVLVASPVGRRAEHEVLSQRDVGHDRPAVAPRVVDVLPRADRQSDSQDDDAITDDPEPLRRSGEPQEDEDAGGPEREQAVVLRGHRQPGQEADTQR